MIDLQLVRFSPISIDLQFFLYLGLDKPFREAHERKLLTSYVQEFNLNLPRHEPKLTFETLEDEYNKCRLFGVLLAATIRPACFLEGWVADNDGEVNEAVVSNFIEGLPVETLMKSFHEDAFFRAGVMDLLEELVCELNIYNA